MEITIKVEAEALAEMDASRLAAILDAPKNTAIYRTLRELADDSITSWDIQDRFRNCPGCIDEDGYYRLFFTAGTFSYYSRNSAGEAFDFMKAYLADYYPDALEQIKQNGCDLEKVEKYISVLEEDGCYINIADKDYNYMDGVIKNALWQMLAKVQEDYDNTRDQFDDSVYLADALISCEYVDNYYIVNGNLYFIDEDAKECKQVA